MSYCRDFQDYDEWLWGGTGPWGLNPHSRRPDVVLVETGIHTCAHARSDRVLGPAVIEKGRADALVLLSAIKNATSRPFVVNVSDSMLSDKNTAGSAQYVLLPPTMVVIVTAGDEYRSAEVDECIAKINEFVSSEARQLGFVVFPRGELERRLMHKSRYADYPLLKPDIHISDPAPRIVCSAILALLSCHRKSRLPHHHHRRPFHDLSDALDSQIPPAPAPTFTTSGVAPGGDTADLLENVVLVSADHPSLRLSFLQQRPLEGSIIVNNPLDLNSSDYFLIDSGKL